jgi:hypothetical protein
MWNLTFIWTTANRFPAKSANFRMSFEREKICRKSAVERRKYLAADKHRIENIMTSEAVSGSKTSE